MSMASWMQARQAEVEAWLASHPAEAERVRGIAAPERGLARPVRSGAGRAVPPRLQRPRASLLASHALAAHRRVVAGWPIGGTLGWFLHGRAGRACRSPPWLSVRRRWPMWCTPRKCGIRWKWAQSRKPISSAWLSKRLGTPSSVPHLSETGYELVGGRLLPGNSGPAAQFMYQDARGQRLTLYVRTDGGGSRETAFRYARENNYRGVLLGRWAARLRAVRRSGKVRTAESGASRLPPAQSLAVRRTMDHEGRSALWHHVEFTPTKRD